MHLDKCKFHRRSAIEFNSRETLIRIKRGCHWICTPALNLEKTETAVSHDERNKTYKYNVEGESGEERRWVETRIHAQGKIKKKKRRRKKKSTELSGAEDKETHWINGEREARDNHEGRRTVRRLWKKEEENRASGSYTRDREEEMRVRAQNGKRGQRLWVRVEQLAWACCSPLRQRVAGGRVSEWPDISRGDQRIVRVFPPGLPPAEPGNPGSRNNPGSN